MFLTRMGFNSKVVVTGDTTQTDLPGSVRSGLTVAHSILQGIEGIRFISFSKADVVRHPLVAQIILAYEQLG
jgi:phosphate starvation-inducible PhoH-like protein